MDVVRRLYANDIEHQKEPFKLFEPLKAPGLQIGLSNHQL